MDFVTDLGPAFVAHRLRRMSDRIVEEIADAMRQEGLTVPPRSASTILLLAERGPLGPVDIAKTLRFSHPLMVRALRILEELGLVAALDHGGDQRRRLVELTERGREEAAVLMRFNQRLNVVMLEILHTSSGSAGDFLNSLDAIRGQLDQQSISTRMTMTTRVDA